MKSLSTPGIVINTMNLGEADALITILTSKYGCLTAKARSVRNSKKRFMGGIDLFDCAVFELKQNKNSKHFNIEAISRSEAWPTLRQNLTKYSLASYCLEMTRHFAQEEDQEAKELFEHLFLCLRTMDKNSCLETAKSLATFYNLTLLKLSGFNYLENNSFNFLAEEIKLWLRNMLQNQTAILPFQPEIIKKTILALALYTESIIERKLFSKEGLAYIN